MLLKIEKAVNIIEKELMKLPLPAEPYNLYDPIRYVISSGGKRIRPALMMLSCNMFTDDYLKALFPALGVEVFHNFTLLHDDLMDRSTIRRNEPTVHVKWDQNIAILSGDTMSILACRLISQAEKEVMPLIFSAFIKTALEVCEGQMMDMDFENRNDVNTDEYLRMIGLKTSVLLAASLWIGAISGGADERDAQDMYELGFNLGMGFQLQDDLLDTFGDISKFGKKIGNDIITNKKTFLYLKAIELADSKHKNTLKNLYSKSFENPDDKINNVKSIFHQLHIKKHTEKIIRIYFDKGLQKLTSINVENYRKAEIEKFIMELIDRQS